MLFKMDAVNVSGLVKTYGAGENAVPVIKGLDFSMEKGAYEAVMGPSGSGKSTFLHLLAGLLKADAGTIEIGGRALTGLNDDDLTLFRRRHIGLIFQDFNLIPTLMAEENVALPLLLDGTEAENKAHVEELLDALGLSSRRHHLPAKLSGGERQRVAIARAVLGKPRVLLAEEPTGNLDENTGARIGALLRELNREMGMTMVIVTHNLELAAMMDRGLELRAGALYEKSFA